MSEHVIRGSLRQVRDLHGKPTAGLYSFTAGEVGNKVNRLGNPRAVVVLDADVFDEDQHSWDEIEAELERAKGLLDLVASAGVEFSDERLDYVVVQIDADLWESLQAGRRAATEAGCADPT